MTLLGQGPTVSEVAAHVLRSDGVEVTRNLAAWLAAQDRLAAGRGLPVDDQVRVGPRDVLLIHEASMVAVAQVDRVRQIAEEAGARLVVVGDPPQLSSIDAGGTLSLLTDGRAETYTLSEVRRFTEPWEAAASLRLHDGDVTALDEYDRHGRIVDAATLQDAIGEAARRTAADLLEGRDSIAVAASNDLAARIATAVRDQLVTAGHVPEDGVHLPRDGSTAAVGDRIMTRHIDRDLGVLNQQRWTVTDITDDGGLQVVNGDGEVRDLPADYVAEHVQSAYGATAHAVQGVTVERCVSVHDGTGDLAALYVPGTRGRDRNTFVVALRREPGPDAAGPSPDDAGGAPSGRAVLAALAATDVDNLAARVQQERDAEWNASMSTIAGKLEDVTHLATLERLDRDLDHLTAAGVLDPADRAHLGADQSRPHLARVVRAAEQSGADAYQTLHDAISVRELDTAKSVAQVLADRIERTGAIDGAPSRTAPERLPTRWQAHYDALQDAAHDRTHTLGTQTAAEAPAWATSTLGPVPQDPMARLEGETRAGTIAAYREAVNWADPATAIDRPGIRTETEKRALYVEAWEALGRPEGGREEATLTDGQLRIRFAAWEREQAWAPPHADPALRHAELAADEARTQASLTRAAGDIDQADGLDDDADRHGAVARAMDTVAEGRAAWAENSAWTRAVGEAAKDEMDRRGLTPGAEADRISAAEWLAAERAAREADDEHRVITEADIPLAEPHDASAGAAHEAGADQSDAFDPTPEQSGYVHTTIEPDPRDVEMDAYLQAADRALKTVADRASQDAAQEAGEWELAEHDLAADHDIDDAGSAEADEPDLTLAE